MLLTVVRPVFLGQGVSDQGADSGTRGADLNPFGAEPNADSDAFGAEPNPFSTDPDAFGAAFNAKQDIGRPG